MFVSSVHAGCDGDGFAAANHRMAAVADGKECWLVCCLDYRCQKPVLRIDWCHCSTDFVVVVVFVG